MSIKSRDSVTNMLKMTIYHPNVEVVNVNVYTEFGKFLSIHVSNMFLNMLR